MSFFNFNNKNESLLFTCKKKILQKNLSYLGALKTFNLAHWPDYKDIRLPKINCTNVLNYIF